MHKASSAKQAPNNKEGQMPKFATLADLPDTDTVHASTICIHAGEGYMPTYPEGIATLRDITDGDSGYDYNDLDADYPEDEEYPTQVIIIEGHPKQASDYLRNFAIGCSSINGADDDHYDYWPSHISACAHLAYQIDKQLGTDMHVKMVQAAWDACVATRHYRDIIWGQDTTLAASSRAFAEEICRRPYTD